jgi:DNA-binding MurR/RpiR family transcriptional regulator
MPPPPAPRTTEAFLARLAEVADTLPPRLRQCAEYLAAHPDRIAVSTVAELAQGAGVQPSALMRFCQMLGFAGFSDMQRLFREAHAQGWPDYATRIANLRQAGAGSPSALLAEFVDAGRKSLENLATSMDSRQLDRAVKVLAEARMIHVAGFRRSFPVASYLAYAFEKMDIPALLHDGVGHLDRRHALRPGDALVAVTFAPYSAETVDLADHAATLGLPVVAITDTVMNPLRRVDATALCVTEVDFGAFRSLSATLALAIALVVAVGAQRET